MFCVSNLECKYTNNFLNIHTLIMRISIFYKKDALYFP